MKSRLFLMAMAGVALASCVNEVADVSLKEQNKTIIGFDAPVMYGNADSRANVYGEIGAVTENSVTYTYPKAENFMIYAVSHVGDLTSWTSAAPAAFNNTAISYDNSVDGWAPKTSENKYYYWENGKKMSFAATSPADLEQTAWGGEHKRTYGATGLIIEDFSVSADASKQFDLLYSDRVINQTSANMGHHANYYSGIPLIFNHALSSIRFSIANSSEESVVLTGIEVDGVKYKGTFNEVYSESTCTSSAKWALEDDLVTTPYIAFSGSIAFLENPRYVSQLVSEKNDPNDKCNQLLLMPQELTDDAIVTVNYTVNGNANTKEVKLKGLKTTKEENGQAVEGVAINEWVMGNRYTYRLYYSASTADKDKIYFAPSTTEWTDVDVIVVPL